MLAEPLSPQATSECDESTADRAATPPTTIVTNDFDDASLPSSPSLKLPPYEYPAIVGPGNTFMIRSVSCGRVLTLVDGEVKLAHPSSRGSSHWRCVETKGWLGFRNPVSGKFLGYDKRGYLVCLVDKQQEWENFVVRQRREGGQFLLMTNWADLWYVGIKKEANREKLARMDGGKDIAVIWEFLEI